MLAHDIRDTARCMIATSLRTVIAHTIAVAPQLVVKRWACGLRRKGVAAASAALATASGMRAQPRAVVAVVAMTTTRQWPTPMRRPRSQTSCAMAA